jgi:hypothetical protein
MFNERSASIDGPLGKHMWNITLAEFLENNFVIVSVFAMLFCPYLPPANISLQTGYIMQVSATATLGLIKLSIFISAQA